MTDLDWMDDANCATTDPDMFTPETGNYFTTAKKICAECDVTERCLQYALANDVAGVWGGTSAMERARMGRREAA